MIAAIADLLACPVCRAAMTLEGRTLRCPDRHTFDLSRAGAVDLVAPVGRRAPDGDSAEMVDAREAFLAAGHYAPIVEALRDDVGRDGAVDAVADLGSGPGHYASALLEALPTARVVSCDLSRAAVSRAARAHPRMGAVRANIATMIPIRDGVIDVAVTVFAPRNPGEWRRILRPGGRALVVIPTGRHLTQLRSAGAVLDIEPGKRERLLAEVSPHLDHVRDSVIEWDFAPTPADVATLVGMGPSAIHARRLAGLEKAIASASTVTASVELHVFSRPAGPVDPAGRSVASP